MDKEKLSQTGVPPNCEEELADILIAISVVAKRLAKVIREEPKQTNAKEGCTNGS